MNIVTPDLCDAYPDIVRIVEPLFTNYGGREAFGGQIVTVKCHEDNSLVKEHVANPGAGKVMVVDGGGSLRCALLGDMLAEKAAQNNWAGLIIYGCIRDVDEIRKTQLGVQALRTIPIKSNRQGRGDLNIPITFGGVTFHPGEYVYADNNGIIVSEQALSMPE
ncbi:MAG: ribonuclease activity regulator protein RraA [Pseudomonadales bacterium]|uniref:ribonuclease E activity regulator RraA n=1 Tax=unclassified Ketobacter TaxID=2639109 RepID=UPI000C948030|nr:MULTISPECIES: ribonuclease E activity regulator RraA [unclassified Ketobacter]MAQ23629.1 ribonuclease activity regulator protein RraA [Pseudomonadales bacterium]MEC8809855.1 ribonuclease E activity regulator RraA [Pseudomonadota bacterium]TNC90828.1 MAG: ribonuclease activity regulator protein RraA [Alcanivorax sp.]HAG92862.1 putative 4-hydroxy-4-methyl-2-oxoglutarate aldolase [Gammaproteobacteria bacterium]RLT90011.1 MAG: putative 4-hydroxy-4-methyl-2-oxoglutarate aldolase [Ketobacter sp. 